MSNTDAINTSSQMPNSANFPSAAGIDTAAPDSLRRQANGQALSRLNAQTEAAKEASFKNAQAAETNHDRSLEVLTSISEDLSDAIVVLNESLAKTPTRAVISKDEELNRFIVKIADKQSGEIVREIPSEALLKFARQLKELKGILFDEHT